MALPAALRKEIIGVPAWGWALTFAALLAFVLWRRRQAALAADEGPIEEEVGGTSPVVWPGPIGGGVSEGDAGFDFMDAISDLGDRLEGNFVDLGEQVTAGDEAITEAIETGFEESAELIGEGLLSEEPPPWFPDEDGDQGGNPGGNGRGQIRQLRGRRQRVTGAIQELKRGKENKRERKRIVALKRRRKGINKKIAALK